MICIPKASVRTLEYRHEGELPEEIRAAARHGAQRVLHAWVPHGRDHTGPAMNLLVHHLAHQGFPKTLRERFLHCSEAVSNALTYGLPSRPVGILLVTQGRGRFKRCFLLVENWVNPQMPLGLPPPRRLGGFAQATLLQTHGRGFKLMREHADGLSVLLYPNGILQTFVSFLSTPNELQH